MHASSMLFKNFSFVLIFRFYLKGWNEGDIVEQYQGDVELFLGDIEVYEGDIGLY